MDIFDCGQNSDQKGIIWGMKRAGVVLAVLCLLLITGFGLLTSTSRADSLTPVEREIVAPVGDSQSRIEMRLAAKDVGPIWLRPLKAGIRNAVDRGVSVNTIVLLLLFPLTAGLVAFSRQVIGLSGYGILIPALVSVAFLSTGVLAGLVLFLTIILTAVSAKFVISKVRLPYLPRMAVLIWAIAMAILLLLLVSPVLSIDRLVGLSIYPILLFIMLAESNIEAQITRTWQTAAVMTAETIGIAIVGAFIMGTEAIAQWVLINPELAVLMILAADFGIGNYKGLRLLEVWRFRKLIRS